jgi:thiol-disulfide isomerase/thioredoxin
MKKLAFMALCVGVSLIGGVPARADINVGDIFPSLETAGLTGSQLPKLRGQVLLVDFWASWCAPCKASFPSYSRLNAEFASRGLVIVAVSVDEEASAYSAFVRKYAPTFSVALASNQDLVRTVNPQTMPTSYLVDREGRVRYTHRGFHGSETEQDLRREIEAMLTEKTP